MIALSRRHTLGGLASLGLAGFLPLPAFAQAGKLDKLTISAMPASPSVVIAHLVERGALSAWADKTVLDVWRTPDQMRGGVLAGKLDLFGTPSYSCANLRNRGARVRLVNIMTWGLLYLMERGESIRSLGDLAGKTVVMSFKNDAPDLIFQLLLAKIGLKPGKDITLTYVATPIEASQLMLAGKGDLAVLSEPVATATQMRGLQNGIAVRRALDLTAEYGRLTGRAPRIAQAGMGVSEDLVQSRPELVAAFQQACIDGAQWVLNNPASAGQLGATYLDMPAPMIERSLPHFRLEVTSARAARPQLEEYFTDLMALSPDIIGGRMPDDAFYWGA